MEFLVNLAQPIARDVRVNLRGADAGVTEQFLDHAQIRAMLQQVRRKTMPQHVRRDIAPHARAPDAIFDAQPERDRRERCARAGSEKTFAGVRGVVSFGLQFPLR